MNEPLSVTLMGGLEVQQGDRIITRFKSQKIGALLAYLAYHLRQMHSREVLIDLFWPESTLEAGRNSLSVALSTLRHQLEPPGTPANAVLRADRFSVGLNPTAVSTDVTRFEATVKAAIKAESSVEQIQRLADAADLYQGRLLPGFYEEWINAAQEHLAGLFLDTVNRLISKMEENGNLLGALRYARHAVRRDPLQEQAHHHLIRLLAATGQPGAALRQYKELEQRLEEEMGEEPSAPLRALAREIEKQSGFLPPLSHTPFSTVPPFPSPPPAPPSVQGAVPVTLTFLMTDIQGSTRLWERAGEVFQTALASHHALLRREFARYGGQEINEAGDSFVVAFPSAGKAVNCATAAQQALHEHLWPTETGALRVRMALHTGDVDYREGEYQGLTLHRASRILTAGHGGQILCSEATASLVRRDLGEAARLVDLGVWRLRDVPTPERLFQIEYPGMPEQAFPPLAAGTGHTAHLPMRFTRFFGRDAEIARLIERLRPDPPLPIPRARLVTLTGSGGAGKTRLALEVAERLLEPFQGAVRFAQMADISDPRLIADTILDCLRLVRSSHQEPLEQVLEMLAKQPSLLVLDNFEHLVEGGAPLVQTLLTRLPMLTVLVTSRQLLGLSGEQEFVVPPLITPAGGETVEQLSLYESVQLFVDRAQAAMPHFQVTSGNAPAVAELCQRLEGIPLAIELAAARALVLTPGQMLKLLEQRFDFLVSRKRDTTERHKTLQAAIDWSYLLLTPEVRRFFTRLSVFRGGWTTAAAEVVCDQPLALDYLAQLRECSLVLVEETATGMRFRMLESLREYAREQMGKEERAMGERRHAEYCVAMVEAIEPKLKGAEQAESLQQLEAWHENLRAALRWCLSEPTGSSQGLRLCDSLGWFWFLRGNFSEGRAWCRQFLEAPEAQERTIERAWTLNKAGILALHQGDNAAARTYYAESLEMSRERGARADIERALNNLGVAAYYQSDYASTLAYFGESLAIAREIGDRYSIALGLGNLGRVAWIQGDYDSANAFSEESLTTFREIGNPNRIGGVLMDLGIVARSQGDYAAAKAYCEESLAILKEGGDRYHMADSLNALGSVARNLGDYASAKAYCEESLAIMREIGARLEVAASLNNLGMIACAQGDYSSARTHLTESLDIRKKVGERWGIAGSLESLAELTAKESHPSHAAVLWGAAEALREQIGSPLPPNEREQYNRTVAAASGLLSEAAFVTQWAEGRALPLEEVLARAQEPSSA